MAIEAIVFDMDGVLFDTERLYVDAFYEAAAKLALADMFAANQRRVSALDIPTTA